ncbi:Hypothetical protein PHPALM_7633 [Phytophthora palmivora]|uniref:Uncharacterized protein n=1 Tax=Phytophthora palmivora TaxID=4796 RepID=A0A2P4YBU5_9STRA|nr:Hypothetical protein PHPALM_7633 [Phytophthora palmivora]
MPFAKFCQDRYDALIEALEDSNAELVESRSTVEELEEKLDRVSKLREDYSELQATSKSTILCLEDEIDTLKRQVQNLQAQLAALTSHPDLGSPPPTALARLLFNQDQELIAARQRDQTQDQSLLEVSQRLKDRDQDLSKAQQRCQALERSEASLEAAALQLQRQINAQDRRIARLQEERDQFRTGCHEAQSERDQAVAKVASSSERLDKARTELRARGNHVDSMRANISRLDQQVADLQTARSQVDHQFSILGCGPFSQSRRRSSDSCKSDTSSIWVGVIPTPISQGSTARSFRPPSLLTIFLTPRVRILTSLNLNSLIFLRSPRSSKKAVLNLNSLIFLRKSEIEQEDGSPEQDKADDPEMLAALAKSRSDLRRSKPSGGDQGASGTAGHHIDLGGEGSDNIPSDDLPEQSPEIDPPVDSPDPVHDDSDLGSGVADVFPWDVDRVSHLSISTLNTKVLSHLLLGVSEWLFPDVAPSATPSRIEIEDFSTGPAVDALMSLTPQPWASLESAEGPLTFMVDFMPPGFCEKYLEYEEKHLQALWEYSHFLPISEDMCVADAALCVADAALSAYHEGRRQRRSRAGAAWKQFLFRHLIPALRQQYCDLDVLLDPFFLHFPKPRHPKIWYPDVSAASLEDALSAVDLAEPWRLQYRRSPADHPATRIPRLQDKFVNVPPSSQPASNIAVL